jgi:hypothetical protein
MIRLLKAAKVAASARCSPHRIHRREGLEIALQEYATAGGAAIDAMSGLLARVSAAAR